MPWRRPSGWRCNPIWPGSANTTARSRATSVSAWSTPSRSSRRAAAAAKPACSTRRSAAPSPTPRGGGRRMPAGRSSPTPAPACASASRPSWCRSRRAMTTAKLAEQEKKASGRTVDYNVVKPDFFVLSGLQGLKKFYLRGTFKGDEVRILTILYDQAVENTVEPVVIAMSSAFTPFPTGPQAAGPPPRKTVEYGTGIVVGEDGSIVTDRQLVDACVTIAVAGFGNADRVAEDKERDLALLRIYGARGLRPLNLAGGGGKTAVDLTGVADPQSQGGGNAASTVKASVNGADLVPAPAVGFSGAAAMDSDGKFAGLAQLKPVLVAGPANAPSQAALVSADAVRDFVMANSVGSAGKSVDAKAAVVR